MFTIGGFGYPFGIDNTSTWKGAYEGALHNADVTWETAYKQDYGFDMNFLKDKLRFTFDYFHEHRKNILVRDMTAPSFIGFSMPWTNDGVVWYGGKNPELWQECKQACEDFFRENEANGNPYHLVEPTAQNQKAYRYAYRHAYLDQSSPEMIMSTRVTNSNHDSKYQWYNLRMNDRLAYDPTEEYAEMFPWTDGKPFNWEETEKAGELDLIFINGKRVSGKQELQNVKYTRDPRLYETMCVNGQRIVIQYANGKTSGANIEIYVGGSSKAISYKIQVGKIVRS